MKNAGQFWDGVAEKYAKSPIADEAAYHYSLERTRSYLSPKDTILEIGCGTGSTALLLAGDVKQITASDLSANMTRIGSEKAYAQGVSNVNFVHAGLFDNALDNGSHDAILALNVLHLLEDVPAALDRINGLLKPGGIFISKTFCKLGSGIPIKLRIIKMVLPFMQLIGKAPFVNFMEISELEGAITSGGFKIIETDNIPASTPNRYVVARKI